MKRNIFLTIILIFLLVYFIKQNTTVYYWIHPNTNTSVLTYITPAIRELDKALKYAENTAKKEGRPIEFVYFNAYGSGFLEGNSIPNDLDYAVGVNLGKYEYNGNNGKEIATDLVKKMNSFENSLTFYLNNTNNSQIYPNETIFQNISKQNKIFALQVNDISNSLSNALSGKPYVKYTQKPVYDEMGNEHTMTVPYKLDAHEILIENKFSIETLSDIVRYNNEQLKYPRGFSIMPMYYANIIYNGSNYRIKFVPEGKFANIYRLKSRFFIPIVFVHKSSYQFLNKLMETQTDSEFIDNVLDSYQRHRLTINNLEAFEQISAKYLKRIIQVAEATKYILPTETYNMSKNIAKSNLNNPNIILLNEYQNIIKSIDISLSSYNLYYSLKQAGKTDELYNSLLKVNKLIMEREILNKKDSILFNNSINKLKDYTSINNPEKYAEYKELFTINIKQQLTEKLFFYLAKNIDFPQKENEKLFDNINEIFRDAGWHFIDLYWLDNNNIGIIKDDFTKNIDNFEQFKNDNNLIDVNYRLIDKSKAPVISIHYSIPVRWNSSDKENQYKNQIETQIINSKKYYKIKRKFVLFNKWCF